MCVMKCMAKSMRIPLTRLRRQGADIFARVCYRRVEVVVTDYGKPIARIVPIHDPHAYDPDRVVRVKNEHVGSDFDDFLSEEGILDAVSATARRRVAQWFQAQRKRHSIAFCENRARKAGVKSLDEPAEIPAVAKVGKQSRHRRVKAGQSVGREAW